jgi:hypothetical protein
MARALFLGSHFHCPFQELKFVPPACLNKRLESCQYCSQLVCYNAVGCAISHNRGDRLVIATVPCSSIHKMAKGGKSKGCVNRREMFVRYTPYMNSMHGFWIAMARLGGTSWFHSEWWRYWDCGVPLEFVYSPLVPALSAWTAAVRGIPHDVAFQTVSGFVYCLGPVTLFIMAWCC